MSIAGGCRCGACRYALDYHSCQVIYACHCRDCQTATGGGFVLQAMVPVDRLELTGACVSRSAPNVRGALTTQQYCAQCLTRLYSTNAGRPGVALVRAGTLDDSDTIVPSVHMWGIRRQPWIGLPVGAEVHDQAIPAGTGDADLCAQFRLTPPATEKFAPPDLVFRRVGGLKIWPPDSFRSRF